MTDATLSILRCPASGQDLGRLSDSEIGTANGEHRYAVKDGIIYLAQPIAESDRGGLREEKQVVQTFYDDYGWKQDEAGLYKDTKLFVDMRDASIGYTRTCIRRVNRLLPSRGKYILDACCGAIADPGYLEYDQNFEKRICLDLSVRALEEARKKVGDRGIYILGDVTKLPFKDGALDAAVCNHAVYHVPADEQANAIRELARVVRPEGRSVIVYSWNYSPIQVRLEKLFRRLGMDRANQHAKAKDKERPDLYYSPYPREWFESQEWPFRYEIRPWRLVDNGFMRRYLPSGWRGRVITNGFLFLQWLMPRFTGRHGKYPALVLSSAR